MPAKSHAGTAGQGPSRGGKQRATGPRAPQLLRVDDDSGRRALEESSAWRAKGGVLRSQATRWWWEQAVAKCFQEESSPHGPNSPGGAQVGPGLALSPPPSTLSVKEPISPEEYESTGTN